MRENIIETFNLSKSYPLKGKEKKIEALRNINLSIKKGETFGLLGPNGAGKTTLIQILTTLLHPTSGYAIIDGYNILKQPNKVKSKVALMLESDMLYYRITAYDNLKFFCKLYKVKDYKHKIKKITEKLGINNWLDEYVEEMSSGMKMKLALARTLLLNRDIIFLDEPTLGLDVKTINMFLDIINNIESTIILTSHDLNVVEKLCDRIAFINEGKIINKGNQEKIRNMVHSFIKIEVTINKDKNGLIEELKNMDYINSVVGSEDKKIIIQIKKRCFYKNLFKILSNYNIKKFREIETSLEELFLKFC